MKQFVVILALSLISLVSCQQQPSGQTKEDTAGIMRISTGSSFGMCVGYCQHEVTFTPQLIKSVQKGTRSGDLPEKKAEEQLPQSEWNDIISKADWDNFKNLPETIGCPDCADGGAEWIEIQRGDSTKKVTIEFGANIPEIQPLLDKLRPIRERFKK
ncbi:MAG TPA: hypothetical protein VEC36_00545 [Patescibacteria group bacterium]|nr:hypothetical protein [Patescibacteria group bacterium]